MAIARARYGAAAACLVFVALVVFGPAPALAHVGAGFGERYALVVGNSDYAQVEDLPNAARDAEAMAEALEDLRFTVFKGTDLTAGEFARLVEEFGRAAAEADTVVFYYAGHGFQLNGLNHLAPVDAVLRDRARIDEETFTLDEIVGRIHRRQRQTIVFLDACRNNPLPASARDGTGTGLAQVGTGDGIFVAFATQPGNVSYGGTGKNSPFTEALLTHIGKPNRNISSLMIDVRNQVADRTLGRQVPWDQSSLRADFFFNPAPASQDVAAHEPARGGVVIDERELARSIQNDLARLGCYRRSVDGVWDPGSRNSLVQFYREKGEAAASLEPSTDVLAMLQDESGTVCAPPK